MPKKLDKAVDEFKRLLVEHAKDEAISLIKITTALFIFTILIVLLLS